MKVKAKTGEFVTAQCKAKKNTLTAQKKDKILKQI